eukprot:SAG31_NODE_942_length_10853_cov_24.620420_8_plen_97_part_00
MWYVVYSWTVIVTAVAFVGWVLLQTHAECKRTGASGRTREARTDKDFDSIDDDIDNPTSTGGAKSAPAGEIDSDGARTNGENASPGQDNDGNGREE